MILIVNSKRNQINMYKFNSHLSKLEVVPTKYDERLIPHEEMLFKCDRSSALKMGGAITRDLIQNHLPLDWQNIDIVIDTRTHMLMKGMYPCIPGWHHDYVERTAPGNQPNYDDVTGYRSEHIMLLLNGDVAPTEFALGEAEYNDVPRGVNVYNQWHKETEALLSSGSLERMQAPSGQWLLFDDRTMHQGVETKYAGWRYFIRVSRFFIDVAKFTHNQPTDRIYLQPPEIANETRKQVQVYMRDPNTGW